MLDLINPHKKESLLVTTALFFIGQYIYILTRLGNSLGIIFEKSGNLLPLIFVFLVLYITVTYNREKFSKQGNIITLIFFNVVVGIYITKKVFESSYSLLDWLNAFNNPATWITFFGVISLMLYLIVTKIFFKSEK
jgi:hypothetical protein